MRIRRRILRPVKPWEANLTLTLSRSRSTWDNYFNKLGRPHIPNATSQGHQPSGSGEEDFKGFFTIYGNGSHLGHVTRTN